MLFAHPVCPNNAGAVVARHGAFLRIDHDHAGLDGRSRGLYSVHVGLFGSLVEMDEVVLRHNEEVAVAWPLIDLCVQNGCANQIVVYKALELLDVVNDIQIIHILDSEILRQFVRCKGVECEM